MLFSAFETWPNALNIKVILPQLPPMLLTARRRCRLPLTAVLAYHVIPCYALSNHLIYSTPVGQTTNVTVVYPKVYLQLTGKVVVLLRSLLGIILVYCIELHTPLTAPFHSILKELSFADAPKDEAMLL